MHEEIEFKAGISAAVLEEIRQSRALRRVASGRASTRRLLTVYYDTPDLRLASAGLFLRMRRRAGRWEQTVKAGRRATHGLQRAMEVNDPAAGPQPDIANVSSHALRRALLAALGDAQPEPLFRTEIRRTTRMLTLAGSEVEMALDRGQLIGDGFREEICEMELERMTGATRSVFHLAADLLDGQPARLLQPSKATRGLAAVRRTPLPAAEPLHLRPAILPPAATAADVLPGLFDQHARAVAENLYCVMTGNDPTAAHQLRVTLRRLRALLRCVGPLPSRLRPRHLLRRARDIGRAVAPLRDADVLVDQMLRPLLGERHGDRELLHKLEQGRKRRRTEARRQLRELSATAFAVQLLEIAELERWRAKALDRPLLDVVEPTLDHVWLDACEALPRLHSLGVKDRHELRKDLKDLRYMAEIAALATDAGDATRFFALLERLQDDLGLLNDLANLERHPLHRSGKRVRRHLAAATDRFRQQRSADPAKVLARARRHWRALLRQGPFWQHESS